MTVIAEITLRRLLTRRRTLLLLLLAAVPVLLALVFRAASPDDVDPAEWTAGVVSVLGLGVLLPVVALLLGTAALGDEIEDGTVVHVLARPVGRARIVLVKLAVAAALTAGLTVASTLATALVALRGDEPSLVRGLVGGTAFGAVVYSALFLALGLLTRRALVYGLFYVLIWEGLLAGLFEGTRVLSVRQQALGVADGLADVPPDLLDAPLAGLSALVLGSALAVAATALAVRRLRSFDLTGDAAA